MAVEGGPHTFIDGLVGVWDAANPKHYTSPSTDVTGKIGATLYGGVGFTDHYWTFDGVDDYIQLDNNLIDTGEIGSGNIAYTLEAWIYITGTPGTTTSGWSIIGNASANGIGMQLMYLTDATYINFGYRSNSNYYGTTAITEDEWHHIVCTRELGVSNRIYVDGVFDTSYSISSLSVNASASAMQIGYAAGRITGRYEGRIAIVRAYNTHMTDAQVLQNYNNMKARFGL